MAERRINKGVQGSGSTRGTDGHAEIVPGKGEPDDRVEKKKARGPRKGKVIEEKPPLPVELERNVKLQGSSPAWMKLYSAIHREVKR